MARHNFRGHFVVQRRITTTLSPELQKLAHEKAIRWSEALEYGVKRLAYGQTYDEGYDPSVIVEKETEKNHIEQMKKSIVAMQDHINKLQEVKKHG